MNNGAKAQQPPQSPPPSPQTARKPALRQLLPPTAEAEAGNIRSRSKRCCSRSLCTFLPFQPPVATQFAKTRASNVNQKPFSKRKSESLLLCFNAKLGRMFLKEQREHFCKTLIPSSHFKTFINWDQNPSFQGSSRNSVSMIWQSSVLSQVGELLLQFYSQKLETLHVSPNVLLLRNCEIKKLRY